MEEYLREPEGSAMRDGARAVAVIVLTIVLIAFLVSRVV